MPDIEAIAREFLLNSFSNERYRFHPTAQGERGFDLWLEDLGDGKRCKAELKAHSGVYSNRRNLCDRLIFNTPGEKELFEQGATVIVRVFIGASPFRVFLVTNRILANGATLWQEPRYVLRGQINYDDSFEELR